MSLKALRTSSDAVIVHGTEVDGATSKGLFIPARLLCSSNSQMLLPFLSHLLIHLIETETLL
jgi:hypothetical protein